MVFPSRKQPAVLHDDEVGDCWLGSKSEESLSDSESDSGNKLDDCTILDVVVDGDSDQDDIIQDFVREDMNNYKRQRENFTSSVGPQGAAKQVTEIVDVFKLFPTRNLQQKLLKRQTDMPSSFYGRVNYPVSHLLGHGNL
jgi:hypothetical protein